MIKFRWRLKKSERSDQLAPARNVAIFETARAFVASEFVQPGMRVCVIGKHLTPIGKCFARKDCFVLPCGERKSTIVSQVQALMESIRPGSIEVNVFYVAEVGRATDLEGLLSPIVGSLVGSAFIALACFDQDKEETNRAASELVQGFIGFIAADLLARLGAQIVERRSVGQAQLYILQVDGRRSATRQPLTIDRHLLADVDPDFSSAYGEAMVLTGTPDSGHKRRDRFYNLVKLVETTARIEGEIAECGCWRGLSARLICLAVRGTGVFDGKGILLCDSFEGLSEPGAEDVRPAPAESGHKVTKAGGSYASSETHLRNVLADFPAVEIRKGWIPASLRELPEKRYRLVHLDLDLYEPIYGALQYFWPRMSTGGIVLCDDYGSLFWPGARKAFDIFCAEKGVKPILLSTGQSFLIKSAPSIK